VTTRIIRVNGGNLHADSGFDIHFLALEVANVNGAKDDKSDPFPFHFITARLLPHPIHTTQQILDF
jgi:hypothetical protein